ncbi:STAS domain-containing protein [Vibrio sp.]|nr:STAS domain-containing protein [Vibrio sp.]
MTFTLEEQLTIANIKETKTLIQQQLIDTSTLDIDCSQIQKVDAIGIQLLLSLSMIDGSVAVNLTKPSEYIQEIAKNLGVKSKLFL